MDLGCHLWEIPPPSRALWGVSWGNNGMLEVQLFQASQLLLLEGDLRRGQALSGGFQARSETPSWDFLFPLLAPAAHLDLR